VEFAVFTHEPFGFQRIAGEAGRPRRLGMSLRAIGSAIEVDEKTVRKALRNAPHASVELLNVDLAPVGIGEERRRKERKKAEVR